LCNPTVNSWALMSYVADSFLFQFRVFQGLKMFWGFFPSWKESYANWSSHSLCILQDNILSYCSIFVVDNALLDSGYMMDSKTPAQIFIPRSSGVLP
jgi:hypothetical protein